MKWCIVVSALCYAVAGAQTPSQNSASNLQPYQLKALKNALRNPKAPAQNSFSGPFVALPPVAAPKLLSPKSSMPIQVANACAIPLLPAPVNSDVDRGIRRSLDAKVLSADPMPAIKGLSVCGQDNQPAP